MHPHTAPRPAALPAQILNMDMNGFFMENASLFDQTAEEMKQSGETLQQYKCYMEYQEKLEVRRTGRRASPFASAARACDACAGRDGGGRARRLRARRPQQTAR